MAIDNFIPQVWAATMMRYLDVAHVAASPALVNRDYEGEIRGQGDTVKINQIGPITISDYTKNTDLSTPQTLTGAGTELVISNAKSFNFQVDDIDQAQQRPKVMGVAMQRAAYGVADVIDLAIFTAMGAGVAAANIVTADTSMSSTDAYDHLVDMSILLSAANVPQAGRWAAVPPWYHGLLQKDSRFVTAPTPIGTDALVNGMIGRASGFDVYVTNNLPQPTPGSVWQILTGVNLATSYAEQVVEVEAYRPEKRFADAVKGLTVYGIKVVLPAALSSINCTKP
jgi:coat protein Gp5